MALLPQESERFILMDRVPQQVYGRMRMCRAMVNDHFTPAYLAAMTSAVALFEGGYPAERMQFDGHRPNASGGRNEAAAACGSDALNGSLEFEVLERSIGGAQPSAAAGRDTGPDGHAKAA